MKQHGFVLIISLIFLVLMTWLGLAMFGGLTSNAYIAGNLREKSHARDSAQAAIDYVEYWLLANAQQTGGTPATVLGTTCSSSVLTVTSAPSMSICPAAPTIPTSASWGSGSSATPTSDWNLFQQEASGDVAYPEYYVQYLGMTGSVGCSNQQVYYQITAISPGGNADTMAVVQTIYVIGMATTNTACSGGTGGGTGTYTPPATTVTS